MNKAISLELQFFLVSILWGIIILIVYDVLRILRRIVSHNGFFVFLEDLIFWVLTSLFIFVMIYNMNYGIIRGFSIMGMGIGMTGYHFLISDWMVTMITKLLMILLSPIKMVYKQIKKMAYFVAKKVKKIYGYFAIRLKKRYNSVKIKVNQKRLINREKRNKKNAASREIKEAKRQVKRQAKRKKNGMENHGEINEEVDIRGTTRPQGVPRQSYRQKSGTIPIRSNKGKNK